VFGGDFVKGSALLDGLQGHARFKFRTMLSPASDARFLAAHGQVSFLS
jgi:hypothetical protein